MNTDLFMAGIRWVETRTIPSNYSLVNNKPRPGGPSYAYGAYQMKRWNPALEFSPPDDPDNGAYIPWFMRRAGVTGDFSLPEVQDATARWWFDYYHNRYLGNWLLVATAWHAGPGAVQREILEPLGIAANRVTMEQIEAQIPGESKYLNLVLEGAAMAVRYGEWRGEARTYGPLPDEGLKKVALVWHTTETLGMPSYGGGQVPRPVAPHWTYHPRLGDRVWIQDADVHRRVGTIRGEASTGIKANEKAIQVEIIAYTDKEKRDDYYPEHGLWVGEFNDAIYAELARFTRMLIDAGIIDRTYYGPTKGQSTWYKDPGPTFPRMSTAAWYDLNGTGTHGIVPGQTHGDTGILDIGRIVREATQEQETDSMSRYFIMAGQKDKENGDSRDMSVEDWQARLVRLEDALDPNITVDWSSDNRKAFASANLGLTLGLNDEATQELCVKYGGATAIGGTQARRIEDTEWAVFGNPDTVEHNHDNDYAPKNYPYEVKGHDHERYSIKTHTHPGSFTTDGADS